VTGAQRTERAAVLLILALATWWAEWVPAVLVGAFILWLALHTRIEGEPGDALQRRWRRVRPLAPLLLVPLLLAGTLVFWMSTRPLEAKVVPVAFSLCALWLLGAGGRRLTPQPR
jgi:hypothetical protein